MNRSPAFQFYPDKWQSHTRRLSDSAYRFYHELICWMWQQSDDYCSITTDVSAISIILVMQEECICKALAEIQNKHAPLLHEEDGRYVSNGLRKEADKQKLNREKRVKAANVRWSKQEHMQTQCTSNAHAEIVQCSLSLSPSPIPSLSPDKRKKNTSCGDKPPRPRNPITDALGKLDCSDLKQMTASAWGRVAKAKKEIVEVCPDVSPEEINRRAENYKAKMGGAMLTSTALSANWAKCDIGSETILKPGETPIFTGNNASY